MLVEYVSALDARVCASRKTAQQFYRMKIDLFRKILLMLAIQGATKANILPNAAQMLIQLPKQNKRRLFEINQVINTSLQCFHVHELKYTLYRRVQHAQT